jgi:hypothetical protein
MRKFVTLGRVDLSATLGVGASQFGAARSAPTPRRKPATRSALTINACAQFVALRFWRVAQFARSSRAVRLAARVYGATGPSSKPVNKENALTRSAETLPKKEQHEVLDVAEQAFAAICQGDTTAADVYRVHAVAKQQDWTAIRQDLLELSGCNDTPLLAQRLRDGLATVVESLVTDHFYANLEVGDRDLFAKLLRTNRETEDRRHDISTTHDFAYASVLEFVIFNGWASDNLTLEDFAALQKTFIDHCIAHCALELTFAKARAHGEQISPEELERGKTIVARKNAARRAFAGAALTEAALPVALARS